MPAGGAPGFSSGRLCLQANLFLSARERPADLAPALLAEHEAQLARRPQALRMVGPERGARLVELERAEAGACEEALLASHFFRPLRAWRGNDCRHPQGPLRSRLRHRTWAIKPQAARVFKSLSSRHSRKTQGFRVFPANTGDLDVLSGRCGNRRPQSPD